MRIAQALGPVLDEILELVFPPRCAHCGSFTREGLCEACVARLEPVDGPYCPRCGHPYPPTAHGWPLCATCRAHPHGALDGARSVGFHVGPLRQAVLQFKFNGRRDLARPLGAMLARRLDNEYARPHRLPLDDITAIVPVVLHPQRRRWRGFDQATVLAKELSRRCGKPAWEDALARVKNTRPQIELSPRERADNMRGAFAATGTRALDGASLLLVDDVYTTGVTLVEAARALKRAGAAAVYGLTLTRAAPLWHPASITTPEGPDP